MKKQAFYNRIIIFLVDRTEICFIEAACGGAAQCRRQGMKKPCEECRKACTGAAGLYAERCFRTGNPY